MLTGLQKIRIVIKDFEIGRLEMLFELQKVLKGREKNPEKMLLVNTAINLGVLYDNKSGIEISAEYDSITNTLINMYNLEGTYDYLEGA